jgi:hypothetical protein
MTQIQNLFGSLEIDAWNFIHAILNDNLNLQIHFLIFSYSQ